MNRRRAVALLGRWGPALAWMGVILFFSSRARPLGPVGDTAYGGLAGRLAHVGEYAVLSLLLHRALDPSAAGWRRAVLAFAAAVAFALVDEAYQGFFPARQPSLRDVAYDALGAAAALLAVRVWGKSALANQGPE